MKTLLFSLACALLLTPASSPAAPLGARQDPPQQENPTETKAAKKARKKAESQKTTAYKGSYTHKHEFLTDEDDEAARRDSIKAARKARK